jgi:hypothetical protein
MARNYPTIAFLRQFAHTGTFFTMHTNSQGKTTRAIQTLMESKPEPFTISWKANQSHSNSHGKPTRAIQTIMEISRKANQSHSNSQEKST